MKVQSITLTIGLMCTALLIVYALISLSKAPSGVPLGGAPPFISCADEYEHLSSKDSERRAIAATRLEGCDPNTASPLLVRNLLYEDEYMIAFKAARSLSVFDTHPRLLEELLNSSDADLRERGVRALGSTYVLKYSYFLNDPDPSVRLAITSQLAGRYPEVLRRALRTERDPYVRKWLEAYANRKEPLYKKRTLNEILDRERRLRSLPPPQESSPPQLAVEGGK